MSLRIRTGTIRLPSHSGDVNVASVPVDFGREVLKSANGAPRAWASVNSFNARFDRADHNLHQLSVDLNVRPPRPDQQLDVVNVEGKLALRDFSGTFDDTYSGSIGFVVMAEVDD